MARVSLSLGLLALLVRAAEASRPSQRLDLDAGGGAPAGPPPPSALAPPIGRDGGGGSAGGGLLQESSSQRHHFQTTASGKLVVQSSDDSDLLEVVKGALPIVKEHVDKLAEDANLPEVQAPMVKAMKKALDLLQGFLKSSVAEDLLERGLSLAGELPGVACLLGVLQGALSLVVSPIPTALVEAFVAIRVRLDALLRTAAQIEGSLRRILATLDVVLMHLDALHQLQIETYLKTDRSNIWILGDHFQKGLRMIRDKKNSSEILQVFRPLVAEDRARSDGLRAVFVENMELLASCESCGGKAAAALWYHQALAARFHAFSILHTVSLLEMNFAVMEQDLIDLSTDLEMYNNRSLDLELRPWLQLNPEGLAPYVEVPYAERKAVAGLRTTLRIGSLEEKERAAQNLSLMGPKVAAPAVSTLRHMLRNLNFTASLAEGSGHCIPSKARSARSWWPFHKSRKRVWTPVGCKEATAARFEFRRNQTSGAMEVLLPADAPGCTAGGGPARRGSRPAASAGDGHCAAALRSRDGSGSSRGAAAPPRFEIPLGPSGGAGRASRLGVAWQEEEKVNEVEACWACQEDAWSLVEVHSPECLCAVQALEKLGGPASREAVPELRGLALIASPEEFPCAARAVKILAEWAHKT